MDNFVIKHNPDLCFVECTAADLGYATPERYLPPAVDGIINKLLSNNVKVYLLHLYRATDNYSIKDRQIATYKKIIDQYQLSSINIGDIFTMMIENNKLKTEDIVCNGIYTTSSGAQLNAHFIYSAFEKIIQGGISKSKTDLSSKQYTNHFTNISPINTTLLFHQTLFSDLKFRALIYYLQIYLVNILRYSSQNGFIVGIFIIARRESGFIEQEYGTKSITMQTIYQWCDKERIQTILFDELILPTTQLSISLSLNQVGNRSADGSLNTTNKISSIFKIIVSMKVIFNDHKQKSKLW